MKSGYSLELAQTQKLLLTAEMRQAILVLQMNIQELWSYVRQEVEDNPLLELEYDGAELPDNADAGSEDEWLAFFWDSSDLGVLGFRGQFKLEQTEQTEYDKLVSGSPTLKDYLLEQLRFLPLPEDQFKVCEFIIGNLDGNGYLAASCHEIARCLGRPVEEVTALLGLVQTLDPPGVGARDLRECLLIQARARNMGALVERIIDRHLDDLARGAYRKLAQEEKVSLDEVLRAKELILHLDPKPGARFESGDPPYVIPDVVVRKLGDDFAVEINDSVLPRIRWNPYYRALMASGESEARTYLLGKLRRARMLLRNIEQRKTTIIKVTNCIVEYQHRFFHLGPGYMEPLTMKEIARQLGIHESTVSRAVSNKYVQTPYGIYPFKAFFSARASRQVSDVSQDAVKKMIREFVENEDPRVPLSDGEICGRLKSRGIRLARRTVSKYRAEMGILPASRRRVTW